MPRQHPVHKIHPVTIASRAGGRTIADLARDIGYGRTTVSSALASRSAWPKLRQAIATELGLPEEDLFADELADEARPKPWMVTR